MTLKILEKGIFFEEIDQQIFLTLHSQLLMKMDIH